MYIRIKGIPEIHKHLSHPPLDLENEEFYDIIEDASENKLTGRKLDDSVVISRYIGNSEILELPWPFAYCDLHFNRKGNYFSSSFEFKVRRDCHFNNFSKVMEREEGSWRSNYSNGRGAFVNSENEVMVSVTKSSNSNMDRIISIGTLGAELREFDSDSGDYFSSHINSLEVSLNRYCGIYSSWMSDLRNKGTSNVNFSLSCI